MIYALSSAAILKAPPMANFECLETAVFEQGYLRREASLRNPPKGARDASEVRPMHNPNRLGDVASRPLRAPHPSGVQEAAQVTPASRNSRNRTAHGQREPWRPSHHPSQHQWARPPATAAPKTS